MSAGRAIELLPCPACVAMQAAHPRAFGIHLQQTRRWCQGHPTATAIATHVHDETDGNPLFVLELLRLLATRERPTARPGEHGLRRKVPPTLHEVIGPRLDQPSPPCNRVLTVAAVVGREFSVDALAQAAELDVEPLLEVLEEAETARVIAVVVGAPAVIASPMP